MNRLLPVAAVLALSAPPAARADRRYSGARCSGGGVGVRRRRSRLCCKGLVDVDQDRIRRHGL